MKEYGAKVVVVQKPLKICEEVYSTGELGTWIKEQSLIIHTEKGLIVITGCAHPGIVKIVNKAKDFLQIFNGEWGDAIHRTREIVLCFFHLFEIKYMFDRKQLYGLILVAIYRAKKRDL